MRRGWGARRRRSTPGLPGPSDPFATPVIPPVVTLGGTPLNVTFAGLVAGEVGVYQINATVPFKAPTGLSVPLVVSQGGSATSLNVRVVN